MLSPLETICMKCQSIFSGKTQKKYHQAVMYERPSYTSFYHSAYIFIPIWHSLSTIYLLVKLDITVISLSIGTEKPEQTVQIQLDAAESSFWSGSTLFATYPAIF